MNNRTFKSLITLLFIQLILSSLALGEPVVVKIGASLPLSGDLSFVGIDILRGLELAKKDFDSDTVKYEIIAEDDVFKVKTLLRLL